MAVVYSVFAEVDATDLFGNDNINWRYCAEHASFQHKDDDACEFILHIGVGDEYFQNEVRMMRDFGCTEDFIQAYTDARDAGAMRVLFHAG